MIQDIYLSPSELKNYLEQLGVEELHITIFENPDTIIVVDSEGKASVHREKRNRNALITFDIPETVA